jgi:hypothetical protein
VYYVKPGRITTIGLRDVDFKNIHFISIASVDSKKAITTSGHIKNYKDIRIKIRPDLSQKGITEKEAEQLKQIEVGNDTFTETR